MKITNKLVGLAAVVLVAAGLGVVTVTAQAGTDTTADAAAKVSVSAKASHKQAANTAAKTSAKQATPSSKQVAIKASAQSQAAASSSSAKPAAKQSAAKASVASSQAVANNAKQAVATSQTQRTAAAKPRVATPARVAVQTPAAKAAAKAASFRSSYGETYVGTISGLGHTTDVVQGSMSRTTAPAQSGLAMTWGGATRLSTTDGLTTEIAGHATSGTFSWIMGLGVGSQVSVTDASGHSRTYTVYATDNVNDQSYSTKTGKDQYNAITSAGQGEAVVLQTCISSSVNRIVWAH
ncbi:sortase domain-containing protein [Lacticaseibacillus jixiensis]|uniref:sortase domain-containing protein n=1 Tax=Lacticaseibacillus jixiensis TaxID=3231926 RepID=UPI0036F380A0